MIFLNSANVNFVSLNSYYVNSIFLNSYYVNFHIPKYLLCNFLKLFKIQKEIQK